MLCRISSGDCRAVFTISSFPFMTGWLYCDQILPIADRCSNFNIERRYYSKKYFIFKTHSTYPAFSNLSILPLSLHNLYLFWRESVEGIDHFINLPFKNRGVPVCVRQRTGRGIGVFLFGGEDLVNEGDEWLLVHTL